MSHSLVENEADGLSRHISMIENSAETRMFEGGPVLDTVD